jgi:hypothetical protein
LECEKASWTVGVGTVSPPTSATNPELSEILPEEAAEER